MNLKIYAEEIFDPTLIIILFLGLVPILNAGYDHDILFWLIFISLPILFVITIQNKKDYTLEFNSPNFFLILIIFWSFISIFWSINYVRSIIEWFQLFSAILIFLLIKGRNKKDLIKVVKIIHITGLGIAGFGMLEYIFVAGRRIVSTFPNPNPFGIYLAMLFLFTINLSLKQIKENRKINKYDIFSVIFLTALILTGSRGSYISLLIALLFIFIIFRKENYCKRYIEICFNYYSISNFG